MINLETQRRARFAKPLRLMPDLDGYSCLIDFGLGHERHPILAWALLDDQSISGMIIHEGTLAPVTQFTHRFEGYCDDQLERVHRQPPSFLKPSLRAASDHFDPPHCVQCPDMAELSVALFESDHWSFKRLQMWHLQSGDIVPMVDYQTHTQHGPKSVRIDARRYSSYAGLVTPAQIGQLKAGGPVGMDFLGLLAPYRT